MEYRRFDQAIFVRLDKGDEVISSLTNICETEKIQLGMVSGLGAVDNISLGIFDTKKKEYFSKQFSGDFEILTLTGNITCKQEDIYIHVHLTIGNVLTNEIYGGHLNNAIVSATVEVVLTVVDGKVGRKFSDMIGLNLLEF
ncbi:MAG: DNA-binding protein [Clostridiales bacterium]|jgi:predicted DNA-binding protein with PD1-like motif|nr:DNA-binding protein [Clostridiales bacterium]